jgi:hypothetical protein
VLKKLILASALSLAIVVPARADGVCFKAFGNSTDTVCYDADDDGMLTPSEESQIARIIGYARRRDELRQEKEAAEFTKQRALEDARYRQCSIPLLWINCPARTPEAERYWTNIEKAGR